MHYVYSYYLFFYQSFMGSPLLALTNCVPYAFKCINFYKEKRIAMYNIVVILYTIFDRQSQ